MSLPMFVKAHAAHADWRVALAQSLKQIRAQIEAHKAPKGESGAFTLGWCYLTDHYAPEAEAILDELRRRVPGAAWVGTTGIGVAASGVEYFDEPALVLMVAPLDPASFRLFSGRHPLPAPASGFAPHTALVHADGGTPTGPTGPVTYDGGGGLTLSCAPSPGQPLPDGSTYPNCRGCSKSSALAPPPVICSEGSRRRATVHCTSPMAY